MGCGVGRCCALVQGRLAGPAQGAAEGRQEGGLAGLLQRQSELAAQNGKLLSDSGL